MVIEREGGKEEGGEKESKFIIVLYYVIAYHADINLDHIYMYTCELHVNFIQVFAILRLWYMCVPTLCGAWVLLIHTVCN